MDIYKILYAGDIGWGPGHWPMVLVDEDGQEFEKQSPAEINQTGDVVSVAYASADGRVIHVLND